MAPHWQPPVRMVMAIIPNALRSLTFSGPRSFRISPVALFFAVLHHHAEGEEFVAEAVALGEILSLARGETFGDQSASTRASRRPRRLGRRAAQAFGGVAKKTHQPQRGGKRRRIVA